MVKPAQSLLALATVSAYPRAIHEHIRADTVPEGYGAPYVCESLAKGGMCSAGAFAHPAFLKESHFYNLESMPLCAHHDDTHLADSCGTEPLFLSCSEIDHTFPNEFRNRAVDIMQAEKKVFQVQLFQGVEHGFALRG